MQVDAVVLAGGLNCGPLREYSSTESEALIPIGNRPMVEYVVSALKHTPEVKRVVVAGPLSELEKVFSATDSITLIEGGQSAVITLQMGIRALKDEGVGTAANGVLVTAADIPMITPEAISDFLQLCRQREGDLYYPVVSKAANEYKYPGVKRTYVPMKEGLFTGGNLILINPEIIDRCAPMAEKMVARRKDPMALSQLLGFRFLLKFLLRQLTLEEAEVKVSELLGIRGVAVISSYPEVGVDVDKPSDLQLARRLLAKEVGI
ncbi:MAG: NTP transferase domain-containing protein [Firmicutes bacterium]|nr:NTP transferase domain-containing protein [Bacillota bacterium]